MPLARSHELTLGCAVVLAGLAAAACTAADEPATARPASSVAEPASAVSRLTDLTGFIVSPPDRPQSHGAIGEKNVRPMTSRRILRRSSAFSQKINSMFRHFRSAIRRACRALGPRHVTEGLL